MTDREISYIQFLSLYKAGRNDVEIGRALDISRHRIGVFRRKFELPSNAKRKYFFTEEMDEKIKQMHADECTIREITDELGFPYQSTRLHCIQLGIDTGKYHYSGHRRTGTRYSQKVKTVLEHLEEHGPTWRSILIEELGIPGGFFSRFLRESFDEVECFRIKRGKGKRVRTVHEVYGELTNRPFLAIRNDPRVINFVASKIAMKVENGRDAAVLAINLGNHLGKERTREVIERLYTYIRKPPRNPRKRKEPGMHANARVTDEGFFKLYEKGWTDTMIAAEFGIQPNSIGVRRRKIGLPVNKRKKGIAFLIECPECSHRFNPAEVSE